MKTLLIFFCLALASYSMAIGTEQNAAFLQLTVCQSDSIIEKDLIKKTVEQYYIKGLQTRDFNLIRSVCIEEAKLYGVRSDGSLNKTSLDQWSKKFDPDNPPFKTLEYKIRKIDYEGTAAQVKIQFIINNDLEIHDYLNLLKIKGNWRIVNIIDF